VVLVAEEREPDRALVLELLQLPGRVGTDPEHGRVADLAQDLGQLLGLRGAPRRVGLRIEVHQHLAALEVVEAHVTPVLVRQGEVRGLVSCFKSRHRPTA
jgi:hypothetical protein